MNEKPMKIKAPKRRGEWVELRFIAAAAENDLHVTKPWGDSAQYDFVLEHQGRFLRIQVKSTQFFDRGCYPCAVRGSHWRYDEDAFDFLAVYILPEDLWYIIPKPVLRGQASVALRPSIQDSKYAKYLGAWELIKEVVNRT
jgi:PD-(D/E)XK endonuclease